MVYNEHPQPCAPSPKASTQALSRSCAGWVSQFDYTEKDLDYRRGEVLRVSVTDTLPSLVDATESCGKLKLASIEVMLDAFGVGDRAAAKVYDIFALDVLPAGLRIHWH